MFPLLRTYVVGICAATALLGACEKPPDPERKKALTRLRDVRPLARIVAIKQLAAGADRLEATAIARAAQDAPAEVRREVATALGRAKAVEATDLLGVLLRDPSDEVRAAAVAALATRDDPKVRPYIVSAWEHGGPRTRATIAGLAKDVFIAAVAVEAKARGGEIRAKAVDQRMTVRIQGIEELGSLGDEEAIAELSARLEDANPGIAAAAARGLARARAVEQVPLLAKAVRSRRPLVVEAAAEALAELGPGAAARELVEALAETTGDEADALLAALEGQTLPVAEMPVICAFSSRAGSAETAVRAFVLAGRSCAFAETLPTEDAALVARLSVLAFARRSDPAALVRARALVVGPDAVLAAAAATYLGSTGEKKDADLLAKIGGAEQERLAGDRSRRRLTAAAGRADVRAGLAADRRELEEMLDAEDGTMPLAKVPKPLSDKLSQLIMARRSTSETLTFEPRPGSIALIVASSVGAARLGADVNALGQRLLDDEVPELRAAAVEISDLGGERATLLRDSMRQDPDPNVVRLMAIRDLEAGRPEALEKLVALAPKADPEARAEIARALNGLQTARKAKPTLLALAAGGDAAVFDAVSVLATLLPDPEVEAALAERLADVRHLGAHAAIDGLAAAFSKQPWPAGEAALARAAVHPLPVVRERALKALAAKPSCGSAAALSPLGGDVDRSVRVAAAALQTACKTAGPRP